MVERKPSAAPRSQNDLVKTGSRLCDNVYDLTAQARSHQLAIEADRPPLTYLERLAQKQAARHAAALDLAHAAESAIVGSGNQPFGAVAGLLRSPAIKGIQQFQNQHERGFIKALDYLRKVERDLEDEPPPRLFTDEWACRLHLLRWQQAQQWQCPHCGGEQRYWLTTRRQFECACGRQFPEATQTIFAGSHLPLSLWFTAVVHSVYSPNASAAVISRQLAHPRLQTIRGILRKVDEALASANATQLLAGVNQVALAHLLKAHCDDSPGAGGTDIFFPAELPQQPGFTEEPSTPTA